MKPHLPHRPTNQTPKPPVASAGDAFAQPGAPATIGTQMLALALLVGFVVGLAVWGLLRLSAFLTSLVWDRPWGSWWAPVAIGAVGGLLIGLWTTLFRNEPRSLEEVLQEVRSTGGYTMPGKGGVAAGAVSFLLPLAFGGSVGPEAGLTGIAAASCTWIGRTLRRAGVRAARLTDVSVAAVASAVFASPLAGVAVPASGDIGDNQEDRYAFKTPARLLLYGAAAFGSLAGAFVLTAIFGASEGLPRFEACAFDPAFLLWLVPLVICGYLTGLLNIGADRAFGALAEHTRFRGHTVVLPLACGVVLGLVALVLPNALFSGEEQTAQIMTAWMGVPALVWVATALVKAVLTPLCLHMGWRGGTFFPLIFCGVSLGYGIAMLTGIDPVFAAAATTAALLGRTTGKPVLTIGLLLLCFPVRMVVWTGLAAYLGSLLPAPRSRKVA